MAVLLVYSLSNFINTRYLIPKLGRHIATKIVWQGIQTPFESPDLKCPKFSFKIDIRVFMVRRAMQGLALGRTGHPVAAVYDCQNRNPPSSTAWCERKPLDFA